MDVFMIVALLRRKKGMIPIFGIDSVDGMLYPL